MSDKNANMVLNAVSQDDIDSTVERAAKAAETAYMLSIFSGFN